MEIGMIGFGQMGQFIAKHLKDHFSISAYDQIDKSIIASAIGVEFTSLEIASSKDIVILAVPISIFTDAVDAVSRHLKKGALIVDICSVKEYPIEMMNVLEDVEIIGAHPLFGPQSGKVGIRGLKIVLCPVRTTKLQEVKSFLEELGLDVIVASAEHHDRQMAKTGHLAHFIAKAIESSESPISEPSFKKLIELKEMLKDDSDEMFFGIQRYNRFCREEREHLIEKMIELNDKINSKESR